VPGVRAPSQSKSTAQGALTRNTWAVGRFPELCPPSFSEAARPRATFAAQNSREVASASSLSLAGRYGCWAEA